jgi:GNAT superfamily N-acetyltransferase
MTKDEFHIRPIESRDLDYVAGKCWEDRQTQIRLLELQEILGFGAWEGDACVGQLHCYSVTLPQWDDGNFPGYGRERLVSWPLGWPLLAAKEKGLEFDKPVWGHACFHVGLTLDAPHDADPKYFGRGIGTAMLQASVKWAREHDYAGIIAHGGTKVAPIYNVGMGCLPWTTYASMGFECVAMEEDGKKLPEWTKNEDYPKTMAQVREAIAAGRGYDELCARLMLLRF